MLCIYIYIFRDTWERQREMSVDVGTRCQLSWRQQGAEEQTPMRQRAGRRPRACIHCTNNQTELPATSYTPFTPQDWRGSCWEMEVQGRQGEQHGTNSLDTPLSTPSPPLKAKAFTEPGMRLVCPLANIISPFSGETVLYEGVWIAMCLKLWPGHYLGQRQNSVPHGAPKGELLGGQANSSNAAACTQCSEPPFKHTGVIQLMKRTFCSFSGCLSTFLAVPTRQRGLSPAGGEQRATAVPAPRGQSGFSEHGLHHPCATEVPFPSAIPVIIWGEVLPAAPPCSAQCQDLQPQDNACGACRHIGTMPARDRTARSSILTAWSRLT